VGKANNVGQVSQEMVSKGVGRKNMEVALFSGELDTRNVCKYNEAPRESNDLMMVMMRERMNAIS
jgi:hypothetical protein